jgi:hypothetical protein
MVSIMSAQQPGIDHLSRLPAELRLEIVHFLRKTSDRKSLSLVSKEWKDVVLPELSKRIQTDLVERQGRQISDLIRLGSHALRYVQELITEEVLDRDTVAASLRTLISAVPRGQLRKIYLANVVRPATLLLLLHQQTKLATLDFTGQGACKHVLGSTAVDQCLSQIKAVCAEIESDSTKLIRTLLAKCPKLHKITFGSRIDTDSTVPLLSEEAFRSWRSPQQNDCFRTQTSRILHCSTSQDSRLTISAHRHDGASQAHHRRLPRSRHYQVVRGSDILIRIWRSPTQVIADQADLEDKVGPLR